MKKLNYFVVIVLALILSFSSLALAQNFNEAPMLKEQVENGELSLQFRTSDLEGTYKVEIEGFSREGKAVTLEQHFTVTQNLE